MGWSGPHNQQESRRGAASSSSAPVQDVALAQAPCAPQARPPAVPLVDTFLAARGAPHGRQVIGARTCNICFHAASLLSPPQFMPPCPPPPPADAAWNGPKGEHRWVVQLLLQGAPWAGRLIARRQQQPVAAAHHQACRAGARLEVAAGWRAAWRRSVGLSIQAATGPQMAAFGTREGHTPPAHSPRQSHCVQPQAVSFSGSATPRKSSAAR